MGGPYDEIQVVLHRDSYTTPWGFRLQGGKDFNAPLTVQRVFVGSPSQLELQRGDTILNIENYDVTGMMHAQAQNIIKKSGGSLTLTLKRGPGTRSIAASKPEPPPFFRSKSLETGVTAPPGAPIGTLGFIPTTKPKMANPAKNQSYGIDYSRPCPPPDFSSKQKAMAKPIYGTPQAGPTYPGSMLNRLNQSLNNRLFVSGGDEYYDGSSPSGGGYHGGDNGISYFDGTPARPHSAHSTYNNTPKYQPDDHSADYNRKSVKELKNAYNKPWKQNESIVGDYTQPRSPRQPRRVWQKPEETGGALPGGLREPGWDPRIAQQQRQQTSSMQWRPVHAPAPVNRGGYAHNNPPPPAVNARQPPAPGVKHIEYEEPAWKGTLNSTGNMNRLEARAPHMMPVNGARSGSPNPSSGRISPYAPMKNPTDRPQMLTTCTGAAHARSYSPMGADGRHSPGNSPVQSQQSAEPHQPRLQTVTYSGGNAPVYSQQTNPPPMVAPDATVQHLQYNSPLQLYSRDNVNQVISSQTTGMPGEGTIQVTGGGQQQQQNFANSDLARMIHQEDRQRAASPFRDSARNTLQPPGQDPQYAGYVDQARQSPIMFALQQHVIDQDRGASDF